MTAHPYSAPPAISNDVVLLSFPLPHVLFVQMNRPKQLNAMNAELNQALNAVFDWFEGEPELRACVLGSTSRRAWCAGADLIAWQDKGKSTGDILKAGFGGIAERFTKKPIIGAINGYALGGGSEMTVNLDLVVAGESATFGFPEVKRGVSVLAGGVPRFVRLVGHARAMECVLTGRNIPSREALQMGMINAVVPDDDVEKKALELAGAIADNSPDSVVSLMYGVRIASEVGSVSMAQKLFADSPQVRALQSGQNIKEGLLAFKEKRKPNWVGSKL